MCLAGKRRPVLAGTQSHRESGREGEFIVYGMWVWHWDGPLFCPSSDGKGKRRGLSTFVCVCVCVLCGCMICIHHESVSCPGTLLAALSVSASRTGSTSFLTPQMKAFNHFYTQYLLLTSPHSSQTFIISFFPCRTQLALFFSCLSVWIPFNFTVSYLKF